MLLELPYPSLLWWMLPDLTALFLVSLLGKLNIHLAPVQLIVGHPAGMLNSVPGYSHATLLNAQMTADRMLLWSWSDTYSIHLESSPHINSSFVTFIPDAREPRCIFWLGKKSGSVWIFRDWNNHKKCVWLACCLWPNVANPMIAAVMSFVSLGLRSTVH